MAEQSISEQLNELAEGMDRLAKVATKDGDSTGAQVFEDYANRLRAIAERLKDCVVVKPSLHVNDAYDDGGNYYLYGKTAYLSVAKLGHGKTDEEALADLQSLLDEQR